MDSFWEYLKDVFDTDKDGEVSAKEVFISFASFAPIVIAVFVEIMVGIAEVRVWDLGMQITQNNAWKAIGFVMISATPFYLGQLGWLYPRAGGWQKFIGICFVLGGLVTSAVFGRADLLVGINAIVLNESDIASLSALLIPIYIIAALVWLWKDAGIQQIRIKIIAKAKAEGEAEKLANMRVVLGEYKKTHDLHKLIEDEFGVAAVEEYEIGNGKKKKEQKKEQKKEPAPVNMTLVHAADSSMVKLKNQLREYTLSEFLESIDQTAEGARAMLKKYDLNTADEAWSTLRQYGVLPTDLTHKNFNRVYVELNPMKAS